MTPERGSPELGARLPALGPRGEGWVIGQFVLIWLVVALSIPGLSGLADMSPARWIGLVIGSVTFAIGAVLLLRGFLDLGVSFTPLPRPRPAGELVETGLYATIRHPVYAGVLLMCLGWATLTTSLPSLVACLGLVVWLDGKARREEAWLVERYPGYAAYRRRTRRLIPRVY